MCFSSQCSLHFPWAHSLITHFTLIHLSPSLLINRVILLLQTMVSLCKFTASDCMENIFCFHILLFLWLFQDESIYNLNGDLTYSTSSADFLNMRVYKIKLILVNKCFIHFLLHCFCTVLFLTTNRNYLKKLTLMKAVLKNVVSCICPSVTFELQWNRIGWVDYTNLLALQAKKSNTGIRFIYSFPLG